MFNVFIFLIFFDYVIFFLSCKVDKIFHKKQFLS
jgi:hypothetical protein